MWFLLYTKYITIDNKVWEAIADEELRADQLVADMADSILFTNPPAPAQPAAAAAPAAK